MFWKYNPTSCPHLEVLLSKEDVTLYEVMNEEEVVQECKVQNKKLIEYLSRPDVLELLVKLATEEPPNDMEEKQRFRYPNIACELLTCDVPQLNERLAGSEQLLTKLYSFLQTPSPLNPLLASFFSKTLAGLVTRRAEQNWYSYQFTCLQVLEFLKSQDDTVGLLIKHLGTSAIMDLLLRLITGVEGVEMRSNVLTWLENQRVVQRIVELMGPGTEPERHCNAAQLLIDVIRVSRDNMRISAADRTEPDPILTRLESPETASQLLQLMLSGGEQRSESAIVGGVSVLLTLLDCSRPHNEESLILGGSLSEGCEEQQRTAHNTARAILPHLAELHDALLHPPKKNAVRTTAGVLDPPLGNTRLQVARLLVALIATQDMETHARLAELGTLNVLLDLFFHYRWNNFLHAQVEQCVALALRSLGGGDDGAAGTEAEGHNSQGSSPSSPPASMLPQSPPSVPEQTSTAAGTEQTAAGETSPQPEAMEEGKELVDTTVENAEVDTKDISPLVFNLFSDCRLLDRILDAWRSSDTEEGAKLQQKCGYYGHLVLMANSIADRVSDSMMERLVPDETTRVAWSEFSAGPLADINKVQSEYLGGQHPARMAAQESDDGDYQNIPFPQEDSVLQTFTELQTRYTTTPFVENFGYDDNQFFDGEDPMHVADAPVPLGYRLGSADEMERRAELFNQVCRQKMMMAADDEELEDQELTFQTAASSHSRPAHRARLSSDDSEEGEEEEERAGPEGREAPALTMEVDSTDPTVAMEIDCDNLETSTKKSIRKFESESGIPQKRPTLSHQKNTLQPNRIAIRMSTAKLEDACLEIVTINDQPFDYLEDSGFRKIIDPMIKALPEKPIISASQMPRKIHKKANEIRESIKTKFKGKLFSMKIDAVSRSDRIFIGVNLQEIADDKLNIVCLGVIDSPVSHTGDHLTDELVKLLTSYDLSIDQIYTITVSNGRNILKMGNILDRQLFDVLNIQYDIIQAEQEEFEFNERTVDLLEDTEQEIAANNQMMSTIYSACAALELKCPDLKGFINVVNCVEHSLDSAVTQAIESTIEKDKSIQQDQPNIVQKVRSLCKTLRTSTFTSEFRQHKLKRPKLDIAPGWESIYQMLDSALHLGGGCKQLEKLYPELHLSDADWLEVLGCVAALSPAKKATECLQAKQLSIGDTFRIWKTSELASSMQNHPLSSALRENMTSKFDDIMANKLFCAAMFLDPRYPCSLNVTQSRMAQEHLLHLAVRLGKLQDAPSNSVNDQIEEAAVDMSAGDPDHISEMKLIHEQKEHIGKMATRAQCTESELRAQISNFVPEKIYPIDYNIFHYWNKRKESHSDLYKLAVVTLGVPSNQVSIKRLFSGLKFLLGPLTHDLSQTTIDDIVLIRTNVVFASQS